MNSRRKKTGYIAKGGLFTAIGVILIYLSTIVPVNKAYLLVVASCIIPLSVITTNIKNAVVIYFATSLLSLVVCGIRNTVVAYIVFFGLYGIIKFYVEKLRKIHIEIMLKLAFFNITLGLLFLAYKLFFPNLLNVYIPMYVLIIGAQIVFIIFDYILTVFIGYSNRYFIKNDNKL
ncbi:hypothetical protein P8V03_05980 [Clostridium sp. A1-XYC3]|uniref:DUF2232 domain-containing protein n=1 Tax=Clostridium tanneri TaxID=3037988 RepID=A0ABU4JRE6_9CLOT|nr:hypothetical protein [Clostridium sp. A1-XYC3]MDW8800700.1 hypothetical protein [Clostridium sp. A1-XYC3]